MTPNTPRPDSRHAAPAAAPDPHAPPQADKARAKAEHQHEDARRKALVGSQHKENTRAVAAPRYHGHRGG
ncbi:hypothetical protein [Achromobacter sp. NFACC18-2]|uniref:hypothetical protein n=1 Tax=Achromobacter sp. NFACC18-2 TaxID=1564112 RepID=UPI0008AD6255|nr:hypothetical protein [Achromobacter sp. NFACC18-2]SEJ10151.1 hypothetical protein SAMN03159494_01675 [Achromobacter sp. NFACC18-2]